jgi:hypothetical protein
VTDLAGCLGAAAGGQANTASTQGWDAICQSFAQAAQQLLSSFAKSFASIPPVSLSYAGVRSVYGLSLEIAAVIAALLLMVQVIRTVATHDGSAIAHGLTGIGKAALAFVLTLGAVAALLRASDEVTGWVITRSFGSPAGLSARLSRLASFAPGVSPSLLLILALLGIGVTLALWGQLLLRSLAVTLLVAMSPVAAAGQVAQSTQQWWRKLVRVTLQLIALKPVVALVFAVGLSLPAAGGSLQKLLTGMLVLLLAACAWPAMARVSSVLDVHVGGGVLTRIRGGAGGRPAGGTPSGVAPGELSRVAEARTMSAVNAYRSRAGEAAREASAAARLPTQLAAAQLAVGLSAARSPRSITAADGGGPAAADGGEPAAVSAGRPGPADHGDRPGPPGDSR